MDLLRREHAPIASASWQLIDAQARDVLCENLSARRVVGVSGPYGIEHAAINLGRLAPTSLEATTGVFYGIRRVLPLVETRVPFSLDLWELDNVVRGARDPDLAPLLEAAAKLAQFEERAIYYGFEPAGIVGMTGASAHERIQLASDASTWPAVIAQASVKLHSAGIAPPYSLIVGPRLFQAIARDTGQYPLRKQIEALVGGPLVLAQHVDAAFLVRADATAEFELVLGQDIAIGFEEQHGKQARLYLSESFTFRVLEPAAVVCFDLQAK